MTALRYKDYQGSVEYEDGNLIIRILHIDDLVTTTISDSTNVPAAFEELVDDYVASCKELGKEPCKSFKGSFNVRITPELHREVAMAAASAGETMNAWIAAALHARVERQNSRRAFDRAFIVRALQHPPVNVEYERVDVVRAWATSTHRPRRMGGSALPPALKRQIAN